MSTNFKNLTLSTKNTPDSFAGKNKQKLIKTKLPPKDCTKEKSNIDPNSLKNIQPNNHVVSTQLKLNVLDK